jgi:serine/threonine-protein kinase
VHDWFTGELLHATRDERDDPGTAFQRFMALAPGEIAAALDDVIDLHVEIDESGWIIGDLYDGCLMYDFVTSEIRVMDFESYRPGPYRNDRGRLPGSTRFMSPEEFQLGAVVDSRTAVFGLGRMIEIFLLARREWPGVRSVVDRATAPDPETRFSRPRELRVAWRGALAAAGVPQPAG